MVTACPLIRISVFLKSCNFLQTSYELRKNHGPSIFSSFIRPWKKYTFVHNLATFFALRELEVSNHKLTSGFNFIQILLMLNEKWNKFLSYIFNCN